MAGALYTVLAQYHDKLVGLGWHGLVHMTSAIKTQFFHKFLAKILGRDGLIFLQYFENRARIFYFFLEMHSQKN
jgi:hypothetical protein